MMRTSILLNTSSTCIDWEMMPSIQTSEWSRCKHILSSAEPSIHNSLKSLQWFSRKSIRAWDREKRQITKDSHTKLPLELLSHLLDFLRHLLELIVMIQLDLPMFVKFADFCVTATSISPKMILSLKLSRTKSTKTLKEKERDNKLLKIAMQETDKNPKLQQLKPLIRKLRSVLTNIKSYPTWSLQPWKSSKLRVKKTFNKPISSTEWFRKSKLRAWKLPHQSKNPSRQVRRSAMLFHISSPKKMFLWFLKTRKSRMRDICASTSTLTSKIWV